jgi:hypothetical protein
MSVKFNNVDAVYKAFVRRGYSKDRALHLATLWQKWYGNKKKEREFKMTDQTPTFDVFAIVELFGHARIAGRVCEQVIAGQGFLRVDVPLLPARGDMPEQPGFTRLFGPGAIYSITPVSEEIAIRAAQSMRVAPVNVYLAVPQLEGGVKWGQDDSDDEDDDEDDDDDHHFRDDTKVSVDMRELPF